MHDAGRCDNIVSWVECGSVVPNSWFREWNMRELNTHAHTHTHTHTHTHDDHSIGEEVY